MGRAEVHRNRLRSGSTLNCDSRKRGVFAFSISPEISRKTSRLAEAVRFVSTFRPFEVDGCIANVFFYPSGPRNFRFRESPDAPES